MKIHLKITQDILHFMIVQIMITINGHKNSNKYNKKNNKCGKNLLKVHKVLNRLNVIFNKILNKNLQ